MEAAGVAVGLDDLENLAAVNVAASAEAVGGEGGGGESSITAVAARSTVVDASVIGSVVVGPVVAARADLDAEESAEEDSSSLAEKAVPDLLAAPASGDVSEVKPDLHMEVTARSAPFFLWINGSTRLPYPNNILITCSDNVDTG
jgi:hypothetical protein